MNTVAHNLPKTKIIHVAITQTNHQQQQLNKMHSSKWHLMRKQNPSPEQNKGNKCYLNDFATPIFKKCYGNGTYPFKIILPDYVSSDQRRCKNNTDRK